MELTIQAVPGPPRRCRLPAILQDIHPLDLLELSGTTVEVSRFVRLSQPTVSHRYRALAGGFALVPSGRRPVA
jgi:hypothetical protein